MEKETYLHFQCYKCDHQLYLANTEKWTKKLVKTDCPSCGEEPYENWIFIGEESKKKVDKRFDW